MRKVRRARSSRPWHTERENPEDSSDGRAEDSPYGLELPEPEAGQPAVAGIRDQEYVYFVHSYYLKAQEESQVAATTWYGTEIHAAVEAGNVFACQFHPEKSGDTGLRILKNFLEV